MKHSIDRRRFLQVAAVSGTAASLEAGPPPRNAAAAEQVVVGVMGLSRGHSLAVEFAQQAGVFVKYVCDVDRQRAARCAKGLDGQAAKPPAAIHDFRRILDDKQVDALVCAAPNHWHAPATILACAAGKHVYVEKPCCHNPHEGELMVAAARKHQRAVQMGVQRRSGAGTIAAINRLRAGVIGRVYLARAWYNSARGSIGHGKPADVPAHLDYDLWQGPAPHVPYRSNVVHYNWHWFWHWGNGELGNNGVHTLDLCRWGLGVDFPIRVTSSGGRYHFADDQQTPDTHTVAFEFDGGRSITWQGLSCNQHDTPFVTFYGTAGSLDLDSSGTHRVFDEKDKLVSEQAKSSRGDTEHLADFLAAIRDGKPQRLNAEIAEGHKSTLLCHLGNIAQRTGRTLQCNPANGRIIGDEKAMRLWARDYQPGWEPTV